MNDLISRQAAIDAANKAFDRETLLNRFVRKVAIDAIKQLPSAQPDPNCSEIPNNSDTISRQQAIDALDGEITVTGRANAEAVRGYVRLVADRLKRLPTAQPEIHFDEWCVDCKEYDHDKHCCPRFNKVIRRTVEELKEGD